MTSGGMLRIGLHKGITALAYASLLLVSVGCSQEGAKEAEQPVPTASAKAPAEPVKSAEDAAHDPKVTALDLVGDPKTAVVSDCEDTSGSDTVYTATGKSAIPQDSTEPRRKPVTAKAMLVGDQWLISDYEVDRSRTC